MGFKELLCGKIGKASRSRKRGREYRNEDVPPTLPKTRPRALTFPGSSHQQASNLFLRLPAEIRNRIYIDVFGYRKVHVAFEFGPREYGYRGPKSKPLEWRWWHCICTWDQITEENIGIPFQCMDLRGFRNDECRSGGVWGTPGPPNGMMGKIKLDFAILQTCRQIYAEGIDILYSTTTFNFYRRQVLCSFPSMVLPHRFALISSFEMVCEFVDLGVSVILDEYKKPYNEMWDLFASMPNLRSLVIGITAYVCPDPVPVDLQEVWLGPPMRVGKLDHFELFVGASYIEHFRVDPNWNFQLKAYKDYEIAVAYCSGFSAAV